MSERKETDFGQIPLNWEVSTLGNICQLLTDGSHLSPKLVQSNYYMASVKDMRYNHFDFTECKTISKTDFDILIGNNCSPNYGDILLSKDGANCLDIIFVYKQKEKIVLLSSIAIARLKEGYYPDFYRYFLLSPYTQQMMRSNFVSGSAIPRVILKDFKNVPVPIIDYAEQIRIAETLTSIDNKIDLLYRQNQTLEALAVTLFKHQILNADFLEADCLGNLFDVGIGRTPPRKEPHWFSFNSLDIKWISIKDMGNAGVYIDKTSEYLTREAVERFNVPIIPANTVLLSFKLTLGRVAITTEPMLSNEAIAHLKIKAGSKFYPEFIYLFLKAFNYSSLGSTSSIAEAINSQMIKQIEMPVPDDETLISFKQQVMPFFIKMKSNSEQIKTLTQLRDSLLPKLMSGEVRIESVQEELALV